MNAKKLIFLGKSYYQFVMNNIELIKKFLNSDKDEKVIIDHVSDEIGTFYENIFYHFCNLENIVIERDQDLKGIDTESLFKEKKLKLFFSKNVSIIKSILEKNFKAIIFSDYKIYKSYKNKVQSISGYVYQKDMEYFIKKILNIDNFEILDFCVSNPHLSFSEISKYLVNSEGYIKETTINKENNFIFEIRKELNFLKRRDSGAKSIYENLKKEVKYKKFNFLTY